MNSADEDVHNRTDETAENVSLALPPFRGPPPLPIASIVIGLVTGVTGTCANAVVLAVLIFARRFLGKKANTLTLITNQSAMDLFACIFLTVAFGMSFPGAPQHYLMLGEVGNNLVCILLRNRVLTIVCMNAGKIGLSVIDVCRSFA